jgi:hypothetical protein
MKSGLSSEKTTILPSHFGLWLRQWVCDPIICLRLRHPQSGDTRAALSVSPRETQSPRAILAPSGGKTKEDLLFFLRGALNAVAPKLAFKQGIKTKVYTRRPPVFASPPRLPTPSALTLAHIL